MVDGLPKVRETLLRNILNIRGVSGDSNFEIGMWGLLLGHFWTLLKRGVFFEVAVAVARKWHLVFFVYIGSSVQNNAKSANCVHKEK